MLRGDAVVGRTSTAKRCTRRVTEFRALNLTTQASFLPKAKMMKTRPEISPLPRKSLTLY